MAKKFLSLSGLQHFIDSVIGHDDISNIGNGTLKNAIKTTSEQNAQQLAAMQSNFKGQITQLTNSLTDNDKRFYFDFKDGEYGYNESETRGADTFHPFRSKVPTSNDSLQQFNCVKITPSPVSGSKTFNIAQLFPKISSDLTASNFLVVYNSFSIGSYTGSYNGLDSASSSTSVTVTKGYSNGTLTTRVYAVSATRGNRADEKVATDGRKDITYDVYLIK